MIMYIIIPSIKHIQLHKQQQCRRLKAFSTVVGFGIPYNDISIVFFNIINTTKIISFFLLYFN